MVVAVQTVDFTQPLHRNTYEKSIKRLINLLVGHRVVKECAHFVTELRRSNQTSLYIVEKTALLVVAEILAWVVDTELFESLDAIVTFDVKYDSSEVKKADCVS